MSKAAIKRWKVKPDPVKAQYWRESRDRWTRRWNYWRKAGDKKQADLAWQDREWAEKMIIAYTP